MFMSLADDEKSPEATDVLSCTMTSQKLIPNQIPPKTHIRKNSAELPREERNRFSEIGNDNQ